MGDKTEDTQPDVFIDGEKLILRVCSRRQRDRRGRESERESGQGSRYVRTTARRASGTREGGGGVRRKEGGEEEESVWLSACKCVCVRVCM